ncbi:hypothetical protein HDU67_006706, partial [Dinochytrium kinnereticum]
MKGSDVFTKYRPNQVPKKSYVCRVIPIHCAAINPDAKYLKELYNQMSSVDLLAPDTYGRTIVHYAAVCKGQEPLKFLISKSHDLRVADNGKMTPLLLAAKYGRVENIKLIVGCLGDDGPDHTLLKQGFTALHYAAYHNQLGAVECLIKAGASVNILDKDTKGTPAIAAAKTGGLEIMKLLVGAGADVFIADKMGRTPLHYAVLNGFFDLSAYLLSLGANAESNDTSENTPLHYAAGYGWVDICRLLIEYGGASINPLNSWKCTPFMVANIKGHIRVMNYLLDLPGLEVNFLDNTGFSPLHTCLQSDFSTTYDVDRIKQKMAILLNRGANPSIAGIEEKTPLHLLAAAQSLVLFDVFTKSKENAAVDEEEYSDDDDDSENDGSDDYNEEGFHSENHPAVVTEVNEEEDDGDITMEEAAAHGTDTGDDIELDNAADDDENAEEESQVTEKKTKESIDVVNPLKVVTALARLLIDHGADLNAKDKDGFTPLGIALSKGNFLLASILVSHGADILPSSGSTYIKNRNIFHALFDAVICADVFGKMPPYKNVLTNPAAKSHQQALVDQAWKLWTALKEKVDVEVLMPLLEEMDTDGYQPLTYSVRQSVDRQRAAADAFAKACTEAIQPVRHYWYNQAPQVVPDEGDVNLDIVWATWKRVTDDVAKHCKPNLNAAVGLPKGFIAEHNVLQNDFGYTMLHIAAGSHEADVLRLLSAHGASVNALSKLPELPGTFFEKKPFTRVTPLHQAALYPTGREKESDQVRKKYRFVFKSAADRYRESISVLLERGANPNLSSVIKSGEDKEEEDETPLFTALKAIKSNSGKIDQSQRKSIKWLIDSAGKLAESSGDDGKAVSSKSPLLTALEREDYEVALWIADAKASPVDIIGSSGQTAAIIAVKSGKLDIVKAIVSMCDGADLSIADKLGDTPMMIACRQKEPLIAQYLLSNQPPFQARSTLALGAKNKEGLTALHFACKSGFADCVQTLISHDMVDLNAKSESGRLPILEAIASQSFLSIKYLLSHPRKSEVNVKGPDGRWALHEAVLSRNKDIVELLLEAGADVNNVTEEEKQSAFHLAINCSKTENDISLFIERLLLKHGANVNVRDVRGRTPLHIAFVNYKEISKTRRVLEDKKKIDSFNSNLKRITGKISAVEQRIKGIIGISKDALDQYEWFSNPRLEALIMEREELLKEKIECADYLGEFWEGTSSIRKADPVEIVNFLIDQKGILLDEPDNFKRSPLHYAARMGAFFCCSYLTAKGVQLDREDEDGNTPLALSLLYSHSECAKIFIDQGSNVTTAAIRAPEKSDSSSFLRICLASNFMPLAYIVLDKGMKLIEAVHDALRSGKYSLALNLIHKVPREAVRDSTDEQGRTLWHAVGDHTAKDSNLWENEYTGEIAKTLLLAKTPFNRADTILGRYPLHYAARFGHLSLLRILLENGAKLDVLDAEGGTPLLYGVMSGSVDVVKLILDHSPTFNLPEASAFDLPSPISAAVDTHNLEVLKVLISAGASPNIDGGETGKKSALMRAVEANNIEMVKVLIQAKADVNQKSPIKLRDANGDMKEFLMEPLFMALGKNPCTFEEKSVYVYQALLKAGATPNIVHPEHGRTPIMVAFDYAVQKNDIILALLQAGADLDTPDPKTEYSPFHSVLFFKDGNSKKLLESFFNSKPNLSVPCPKDGLTPLDWALKNEETLLFSKLISCGADGNVRSLPIGNPLQRTTLMLAIKMNDLKAVNTLLASPIELDLSAEDTDGRTCIHYVVDPEVIASYENIDILKALAAKGAPLDSQDNQGLSPLQYAKKHRIDSLAKELVALGARVLDSMDDETSADTEITTPTRVDYLADANLGRHELEEVATKKRLQMLEKVAHSRGVALDVVLKEDRRKGLAKIDRFAEVKPEQGHVHFEGSEEDDSYLPYSIIMTKCEFEYGAYIKFYVMQVVYNKLQDVYVLVNRWGGLNEDGMHQRTPYSDKDECVKEFKKIFKAKSGNVFGEPFVAMKGKYCLVKTYVPKPLELQPFNLKESPASSLPSSIQDLLAIFTDVAAMKKAAADASSVLPLGNLEHSVIEEGHKILEEMRELVKELDEKQRTSTDVKAMLALKQKLVLLSNDYFTKIPCKFEETEAILSKSVLDKHLRKMNSLRYLDAASNILIAAHHNRLVRNPLDYVYDALSTSMREVKSDTDEWGLMNRYMQSTAADQSTTELISLFSVDREGEKQNFTPFAADPNRRLLWHGSKMSNFIGILTSGLRVAPIEAEVAGYMFGKGIYFADVFKKSLPYTYDYRESYNSNRSSAYSCLLLCEVALGDMYEAVNAEYMEEPKEGKLSTKGLGREGPKEEAPLYINSDGVAVRLGPSTDYPVDKDKPNHVNRMLNYNEYIVYNPNQVRIRYVVLVRDTSLCHLCLKSMPCKSLSEHADRYEVKKGEDPCGVLPSSLVKRNAYEAEVVATVMIRAGVNVKDTVEERIESYLAEKRYSKRWNPPTALRMNSSTCEVCADLIAEDLIAEFMEECKDDVIPEPIKNRERCWYGYECRTQEN